MLRIINVLCSAIVVVLLVPMIASAYTLKTFYQDGFPKYYYNGPANSSFIKGLCPEIMRLIEKKAPDIKFSAPHELVRFGRIKHDLQLGRIDVFLGMTRLPEREKDFIYLDPPLYTLHHTLAMRSTDSADIKDFDDLRKLGEQGKLLTNHGTSSERFLNRQGGLVIDAGGMNLSQNIMKMFKGRGRFVYFHDLGLYSTIKKEGWAGRIKVLPVFFHSYSHYLAFSKHADPEAVRIVKRALRELSASGELQAVTAKYFTLQD
jgi:ABC-type amino acid transport substrate-binding protein